MLSDREQVATKHTDALGNEQPPTTTIEPDSRKQKADEHNLDGHKTDDTNYSAED